MKVLVTAVLSLAFVTGCASTDTKKTDKTLAQPIDCRTAPADIRVLDSEKVHIAKEIEDGATSIIPIGLVVHLVKGDEEETAKIGFGEYNDAIDKKIAEIKNTCNIK